MITVSFHPDQIAPCGLNCGSCWAFQRPKNKCNGCRVPDPDMPVSRSRCIIRTCEKLQQTNSDLCYECPVFPCRRLKDLDKRYRTKYRTSLIQNLLTIKETGMADFLEKEAVRWTCPDCGSLLSVHRDKCLVCLK
jgi:hypothetical protein